MVACWLMYILRSRRQPLNLNILIQAKLNSRDPNLTEGKRRLKALFFFLSLSLFAALRFITLETGALTVMPCLRVVKAKAKEKEKGKRVK